jgi:hypothetical protein
LRFAKFRSRLQETFPVRIRYSNRFLKSVTLMHASCIFGQRPKSAAPPLAF